MLQVPKRLRYFLQRDGCDWPPKTQAIVGLIRLNFLRWDAISPDSCWFLIVEEIRTGGCLVINKSLALDFAECTPPSPNTAPAFLLSASGTTFTGWKCLARPRGETISTPPAATLIFSGVCARRPARPRGFFGAKTDLEKLLGRGVDLVEPGAVRNPYVLASINRNREAVYAT